MQQPGYKPPIPSAHEPTPYYGGPMVNSSGQGANAVVPPEIAAMGFNWGAFALTALWGIFNSVWIALLVWTTGLFKSVPLLPLVLSVGFKIYMGINGNEMAWRNRRFESIQHFQEVQKAWSKWATIYLSALIILTALAVIMLMSVR